MYQSKLLRLWKSFSPKEIKQFLKFLESPYFNTNPTQVELFHVLKKAYPKFTSKSLERKALFSTLYPKKKFSHTHLSNLFSQQFKLVDTFLIQLELEKDTFQRDKNLNQAYHQKAPYEWFLKRMEDSIQKLEEQPYRDTDYYRDLLELKILYFSHPKTIHHTLKEDIPKEILDLLDRYFALYKLHLAGVLKTSEKILAVEYDIKLLEEVLNFVKDELVEENILFDIFDKLLLLQKEPEITAVFFTLKNIFIEQNNKIRKEKAREVLFQLINYAIRQINAGHFDFNREIFDLYKIGLANDLIVENNKISNKTYSNIANIGSMIKEFKWVEKFIEDYASFLEEGIRPYYQALTLAELRFRQNDFDRVIAIISNQKFDETLLGVNARMLIIKSWFEKFLIDKDLFTFLLSQIESFEKYLHRESTISKIKNESSLNFLKILRQIITNIHSGEKNTRQKLLLDETELLYNKVWLKQKLNTIQG